MNWHATTARNETYLQNEVLRGTFPQLVIFRANDWQSDCMLQRSTRLKKEIVAAKNQCCFVKLFTWYCLCLIQQSKTNLQQHSVGYNDTHSKTLCTPKVNFYKEFCSKLRRKYSHFKMAGVPPKLIKWVSKEESPMLPACFVKWLRNSDRACHFDLIAQAFNSQAGFPKSNMATVWSWKNRLDHKKYRFVFNITFIREPVSAIEDCVEVFTAGKHSQLSWDRSFYWIVATLLSGLDFLAANCSACVVLCLAHCVIAAASRTILCNNTSKSSNGIKAVSEGSFTFRIAL